MGGRQRARIGERLEECTAGARPIARLAVDVHRLVVVEPLRAAIEAQAALADGGGKGARGERGVGGIEIDVGLGLGKRRAEEACHEGAVPHDLRECCLRVALQRRRDARRFGGRRDAGIGVASRQFDAVAQVVEKGLRELHVRRGAKADRVRGALVHRDAVVGDRGRYVEHVAAGEHRVVLRRELAQDLDRQAGTQREITLASVAPAAASEALQQEDVVGIEVRSHAAVGHGVAHHHVVQARIRDEGEAAQQRIGRIVVQVHALHEERPGLGRQRLEIGGAEGAMQERVARAIAHREARLDIVARGERHEILAREDAGETGHRCAHEQRLALPVAAQEIAR